MTRLVLALLTSAALATCACADGCYVPRIDPTSQYSDIYEPDQKALLIYYGGEENLFIQVGYKGRASDFVWLIPTPSVPQVLRCDFPVFHTLHEVTAPLIKYWLDPCGPNGNTFFFRARSAETCGPRTAVEVVDQRTVGIYDVVVLHARDAGDLLLWLRTHRYMVANKAVPILSDYVRRGWVFTAARISTSEHGSSARKLDEGTLEPLLLHFRTDRPVYPLRISRANPGRTRLLLYVVASHRMVVAPGLRTLCVTGARESGHGYALRALRMGRCASD